jgi:enolase
MAGIIKRIHAREVFDNKGLPTVEVDVVLDDGSYGRFAAPGGTSRGSNEANDVRDGDPSYFNGMGVSKAIANVNTEIASKLIGDDATNQERIDNLLIELDGTRNKSRLGGNAIVATSIAVAKAAARSKDVQLFEHLGGGREIPVSSALIMYGGPAYVGVAGTADFQEYAVCALSARSYKEGYAKILSIYGKMADSVIKKRGFGMARLASLAGQLTATFDSNDEALAKLTKVIEEAGYVPRKDFGIYIDIAATQLYQDGKYHLTRDNKVYTRDEWINKLVEMCAKYPITSIEDALFEDDWEGWQILTKKLGAKVQLVGDDFLVTNPARLKKAIEMGCANAIVIKPNQIGTLTETIETIKIAKKADYGTVISARSGELWDLYQAHLCVGQNLRQTKSVRTPAPGETFNEITRIQDYLGEKAKYTGKSVLERFLQA